MVNLIEDKWHRISEMKHCKMKGMGVAHDGRDWRVVADRPLRERNIVELKTVLRISFFDYEEEEDEDFKAKDIEVILLNAMRRSRSVILINVEMNWMTCVRYD